MFRVFRLLVQNGSFLLFVCLQLYCLYLIVQYNKNQNQVYLYSKQKWALTIQDKYQSVINYLNLTQKNAEVAAENARLLEKHFLQYEQSRYTGLDSTSQLINLYKVIPAVVINNSVTKVNNTITINKGGENGIEPGMGVVTAKGVLGIVTDTTRHYSLVMSLLHTKSKISAKLQRTQFPGTLVWKGFHPEQLHLEDVQKYSDVKAHDTIVTSGYSLVFPEGLPIGRVEAFEIPQGAFTYSIQVSLFQNLNTIEQVYVIGHNYKNEKDQLEKQAEKYE